MRNKIKDKELEKAILELFEKESRSMTLKEITERLAKTKMKRSPQIILRHIENLVETRKIKEK